MALSRIYFEDQGQDFNWFVIDDEGTVKEAGPFQGNVWVGYIGRVIQQVDGSQRFVLTDGAAIKYPVERVVPIEPSSGKA